VSGAPEGAPAAWDRLDRIDADAVVARGDHSDLPGEWFAMQAERAGAPLVTLAGGHFFLQEDTDRAERLVREHLS
jgi:surfactin synthase thioesterase subunit